MSSFIYNLSNKNSDLRVFSYVNGYNCPSSWSAKLASLVDYVIGARVWQSRVPQCFNCSVDCSVCVVCGCRLNSENRSEVKNVCRDCLHDLEF